MRVRGRTASSRALVIHNVEGIVLICPGKVVIELSGLTQYAGDTRCVGGPGSQPGRPRQTAPAASPGRQARRRDRFGVVALASLREAEYAALASCATGMDAVGPFVRAYPRVAARRAGGAPGAVGTSRCGPEKINETYAKA